MAAAFTRGQQDGSEEATLFYGNEREADTLSLKEDCKPPRETTRGLYAWETRSPLRRHLVQIAVGIVGLTVIITVICTFTFIKDTHRGYTYLGKARFKLEDKMMEFRNSADKLILSGEIGLRVRSALTERHTRSASRFTYATEDGISLALTQESESSWVVNWTSLPGNSMVFLDCLSMKNSHWYGGSELLEQKWPLEKVNVNMGRYLPQDARLLQNKSAGAAYGSVMSRYWLSSNGIAVTVDADVPLHVSINESGNQQLCLKSDTKGYLKPAVSKLVYRILSGYSVKSLHLKVIRKFLGKPKHVPASEIIKHPLWVATQGSGNISQEVVEKLGENIHLHKFSCSQIVIERQYSSENENYNFDLVKFSNPKAMMEKLTTLGCNVSVAVNPHLKIGTKEFYEANQLGYLLQDCGGKVPGLVAEQNYLAACIDMTHHGNKDWFKKQLETFQQEFGFASFEFDGGDLTHLPFCYKFHDQSMDPGLFPQRYAQIAAESKGINVHVGYKTQDLPIFVKMLNKDSTWDAETGFKSLIPTILAFGVMGYPYVLSSVIGGQGKADKELYIRWMQASVLLPGLQFLKKPWDYDKETVQIVQDLLKLRSSLNPIILEAFHNVTKTGAPVIRPVWWIAPFEREALAIDSQFLLGDHYLVAPVLEKGQTQKAVYLPAGQWQEEFSKEKTIIDHRKGGKWKNYEVTLKDLLYFKCLGLCG